MSRGQTPPEDDSIADDESTPDVMADWPTALPEREGATTGPGPMEITVESRAHGWRLDHYLRRLFSNHSRAQLQRAIDAGAVRLNGLTARCSRRVRVNDRIRVELPDAEEGTVPAEDLPLSVLYEDEAIVVLNKAAGMIVHPGRGNPRGTLAGALQFHFNQLSSMAGRIRPGIVHRLDRDTSGVILVARDNQVHQKISAQFERREVRKEYLAIVRGIPELASDRLRTWVCVHPRVRERMMVCAEGGNAREAVTFYRTAEKYGGRFALMELHPATGRTHQLRVHLQHLGTPIVADRVYGGGTVLRAAELAGDGVRTERESAPAPEEILMARQALHAWRLKIQHPLSGREMQFEAPLPDDFVATLAALRALKQDTRGRSAGV